MSLFGRNLTSKIEKYARIAPNAIRWALQGQLRQRVRALRGYRLIAESGLFEPGYYLSHLPNDSIAVRDPLEHYLMAGPHQPFDPHPLFSSSWYLAQNPDVAASGTNPLLHFIESGWRERRSPHPLFDVAWYLSQNPDIEQAGANPLRHYLSVGGTEGRSPHLLFDSRWYLARSPDVQAACVNPLLHYLQNGWRENRDPHPLFHTRHYLRQRPELLDASVSPLTHFVTGGHTEGANPNHLFDVNYYRQLYSDITPETNPLVHYLSFGGVELRSTHPLFDPLAYCQSNPEMLEPGSNPLLHYFQRGIGEQRSPHLLFDTPFYLSQVPSLIGTGQDPVLHYIQSGERQGLNPSELFDTSFYMKRYPEVPASGQNVLVHFITEGHYLSYNPNPLFDTAYYLKQNGDVAATGQNALTHYLLGGAFEGRSPSRFFDSSFYLKRHPQLRKSGTNPLAHYITKGAALGDDPNPFFNTSSYLREHPEVSPLELNPLAHFLDKSYQELRAASAVPKVPAVEPLRFKCTDLNCGNAQTFKEESDSTIVFCISHMSPIRPRAGNEYRLLRLSDWFRSEGYNFVSVLAPLRHELVSEDQLKAISERFGNAILCRPNGDVVACANAIDTQILKSLDGLEIPSHGTLSGIEASTDRKRELLAIEDTFCHDTLIFAVRQLVQAKQQPCIVIAEYVFMSRLLPLLSDRNLKVIDTHDVFSAKHKKVLAHGVRDSLALTSSEESERLNRSDLVLAIQPEERAELEHLCGPGVKVITVGVDFPVVEACAKAPGCNILFVGSDNAMNARGLRDFLRFCWPSVVSAVPNARLLIAGKVSGTIYRPPHNVELLGAVEELSELYRQAKVVINPAIAGTGLKIKTLEALSYQRPLVTWPTGADGLHPDLRKLCLLACDWFDFAGKVTMVLRDARNHWYTPEKIDVLRNQLSTRVAYTDLQTELRTWKQNQVKTATA